MTREMRSPTTTPRVRGLMAKVMRRKPGRRELSLGTRDRWASGYFNARHHPPMALIVRSGWTYPSSFNVISSDP